VVDFVVFIFSHVALGQQASILLAIPLGQQPLCKKSGVGWNVVMQ